MRLESYTDIRLVLDAHSRCGYRVRVVTVSVPFIWLTSLSSFSRYRCGGSHLLRRRRCTWGTSSDACHSVSWHTRSRRRGSTLSARRPSPGSCSRDTLGEPEEGMGGKNGQGGRKWVENGLYLVKEKNTINRVFQILISVLNALNILFAWVPSHWDVCKNGM